MRTCLGASSPLSDLEMASTTQATRKITCDLQFDGLLIYSQAQPAGPRSAAPAGLAFLLIFGALSFVTLTARAVLPPPDGGYANDNTAEGQDALFSLTSGFNNTAVGFFALYDNTTGYYNTAVNGSCRPAPTPPAPLIPRSVPTPSPVTPAGAATSPSEKSAGISKNTLGTRNTASGHNALSNNISGSQKSPPLVIRHY